MKQLYYYYTFLLLSLLLTSLALNCEPFCQENLFSFTPVWISEHLDNSDAQPVPSKGDIPLLAYGVRIQNSPSYTPPPDTKCADNWYTSNEVQQVQIFTLRPFDGLPAGTEVSERFSARLGPGENRTNHTSYVPVSDIAKNMNYPNGKQLSAFHVDFVLLDPPAQPDSCHLCIRLSFADSTVVDVPTNIIFLK